jgi:hypothetical protein
MQLYNDAVKETVERRLDQLHVEGPTKDAALPATGVNDPVARRRRADQKRKKEIAGAAVDRAPHQRGCHPERRSDSSAPSPRDKDCERASRKFGRESATRRARRGERVTAEILDLPAVLRPGARAALRQNRPHIRSSDWAMKSL